MLLLVSLFKSKKREERNYDEYFSESEDEEEEEDDTESEQDVDVNRYDVSEPFLISRYVVEVQVCKGRAPVYFTKVGAAYFRRSGSTHKMDTTMVEARKREGRPVTGKSTRSVVQELIVNKILGFTF